MAGADDTDLNRIVTYCVEITLLDVRQPDNSYWQVVGRGPTPEDAMRHAEQQATAMHEATARLAVPLV